MTPDSPTVLRRLLDSQPRKGRRVTRARFAALVAEKSGLPSLTPEAVTQWIKGRRRPQEDIRPHIDAAARELFGRRVYATRWPRVVGK